MPGIWLGVEECPEGLWHGVIRHFASIPITSPQHWPSAEDAMTGSRAYADQMRAQAQEVFRG